MDGDVDEKQDHSYPVCYVRNTEMKVAAQFIIAPQFKNSSVMVKALGPMGISIPLTPGTSQGSIVRIEPTTISVTNTPNAVMAYDGLVLKWHMSCDGGAWIPCGSSSNALYVTWTSPAVTPFLQTFADIGCRGATGISGSVGVDDRKVLLGVWNKFVSRAIERAEDKKILTYYGYLDVNENGVWDRSVDEDFNSPDKCFVVEAVSLVAHRNGQCGSWADLFLKALRGQGLDTVNGNEACIVGLRIKRNIDDVNPVCFAVKNWQRGCLACDKYVVGNTDAGVDGNNISPLIPANYVVDALGVPGQGTSPNPPSTFANHFIVKIGMEYYDPSYGIGPFIDRKEYEDAAFEGYVFEDYLSERYVFRELPKNDGLLSSADEVCDYDK